MAERMYFFDSTEDDERIYNAADFARFHAQIIGNGVSNTVNLPNLEVTAQNNMNVGLGAGYMFANGYMYENTSMLTLTHDTADSNNDRIDRVVICFDANPEERSIKAVILKGTPASNPVPPPLQRDNYVYQMSVAQVRIIAGKSFIEQSQIMDERANDEVCGYIPLHNIYRGMQINEHGMVTLPNQSFIKSMNTVPQSIPRNVSLANAIPLELGQIEDDKQLEVINDTQLRVKSDGVYNIWAEVVFREDDIEPGSNMIIYVFKNGQESFPIGMKAFVNKSDRFLMVSGFDVYKEGDVVDFRFTSFNFPTNSKTLFTRIRLSKVS